MLNFYRSMVSFAYDGSADYRAFIDKVAEAIRPDLTTTRHEHERCRWVRPLSAALMLNALLAGCGVGPLTCHDTTLRQGETCEVRPAFPRFKHPQWETTRGQ